MTWSRSRMVVLAPCVIATLAGVACTRDAPPSDHVVVPDLTGVSVESAESTLREAGLTVAITYLTDGPGGIVLDQSPEPGARIRPGTTVEIEVVCLPVPCPSPMPGEPISEACRRCAGAISG